MLHDSMSNAERLFDIDSSWFDQKFEVSNSVITIHILITN